MSQFDPSAFLSATITEVQVKRPPLPAGSVFQGTIGEVSVRPWQKKDDPSKTGFAVDIPVTVDLTAYPDVMKATGADKVLLKDSIMLDLNEGGAIDTGPGKNTKLRRYREALGMNAPGAPFSFLSMPGRIIGVKISHRTYEGDIFDQIDSVVKA